MLLWPNRFGFEVRKVSRPDDGTNESIMEDAVLNVLRRVFRDNPVQGTASSKLEVSDTNNITTLYRQYYGLGAPNSRSFSDVMVFIATEMEMYKKDKHKSPKTNFNNEKIREAHDHLRALDQPIRTKFTSSDFEQARKHLAKYLSTVQDFYSNTNWVNQCGTNVAKFIGSRDHKVVVPVIPEWKDTCENCDHDLHPEQYRGNSMSCKKNLLVTQFTCKKPKLTSGYRFDIFQGKPTKGNQGAKSGKCGHGGKNDADRHLPATGGINKETSDPRISPHWFLHKDAAEAARLHTEYFLDGGDGKGGLRALSSSDDKFMELFGVTYKPVTQTHKTYPPYSIGFVIDTTASMKDDIENAKQAVRSLIKEITSRARHDQPAKYVLVLFDDPEIELELETTNPQVILDHMEKTIAESVPTNLQCEEMSLTGMYAALELMIATPPTSGRPSALILITDAPPRDTCMKAAVKKLSKKKGIVIERFSKLGNECKHSGSKCGKATRPHKPTFDENALSEDVGEYVMDPVSQQTEHSDPNNIYKEFGKETKVLPGQTISQALNKSLNQLIKRAPPARQAASSELLFTRRLATNPGLSLSIIADQYLRDLFITIKSASPRTDSVKLFNPTGTEEVDGIDRFVVDRSLSSITLWVQPRALLVGEYRLEIVTAAASLVEIKVEGDTTLTFSMIVRDSRTRPTEGKLVSGMEYEIETRLTEAIPVSWMFKFVLPDGTNIASSALSQPAAKYKTILTTKITAPATQKTLKAQLVGTESDGSIVTRELSDSIEVSYLLLVKIASGNSYPLPGQVIRMEINATNVDTVANQYTIQISSNHPVSPFVRMINLAPGDSTLLLFETSIPRGAVIGVTQTVDISLVNSGSGDVNELQYEYTVSSPPPRPTDTVPPTVRLLHAYPNCSSPCHENTWSVEYELSDKESGLYDVGPDSPVINFTVTTIDNSTSHLKLLISCCELAGDAYAYEYEGNGNYDSYKRVLPPTTKSVTTTGTTLTTQTTEGPEVQPKPAEKSSNIVLIAAVSSVGVVLLIVATVSGFLFRRLRLTRRVKSENEVKQPVPPSDTRPVKL